VKQKSMGAESGGKNLLHFFIIVYLYWLLY
jgi:hypothetical protein